MAAPRPEMYPNALAIAVDVEQREVGEAWHPVVILSIQNRSSRRVAFTRTFGVTNRPWMSFELEKVDGTRVYYPSEVDIFQERPEYLCLQPGELLVWEIDLLSWHVLFGGESWGGPFAFDLKPGLYRLRAQYTDYPARAKARCPGIGGTSSSNWVEFSVSSRGDQR